MWRQLTAVGRAVIVLVVFMVAGAGLGGVAGRLVDTSWTATATAYAQVDLHDLATEDTSLTLVNSATSLAASQLEAAVPLFRSEAVLSHVIETEHLSMSPAALASSLTVSSPSGLSLSVSMTSEDPKLARRVPDAVIAATNSALKDAFGQGALITITVLNPSASSRLSASPNSTTLLLTGIAGGFVVGVLLLVICSVMHRIIEQDSDLDGVEPPVLASVPTSPALHGDLVSTLETFTHEELRRLRTNLRFSTVDSSTQTFVLTSSVPGEGKSTITMALARVIAESGLRVTVLEADFRRPVLKERLGLAQTCGLSDLLLETASLSEASAHVDDAVTVIHAGSTVPNPSELCGSQKMHALIEELSRNSVVLIDAPPLLPVTDAAVLARHVDGVIVLARARRTRLEQLRWTLSELERVRARVVGIVLDDVSVRHVRPSAATDGAYYSTYYARPARGERAPRARRARRARHRGGRRSRRVTDRGAS